MQTQCNSTQLEFSCVGQRRVAAAFDGGTVSSDAGALLLKRADEAIGLLDHLAGCLSDGRDARLIERSVRAILGQRVRPRQRNRPPAATISRQKAQSGHC